MATFSKTILSGSTDGRGIKVAATATAGTLIHTGSATAIPLPFVLPESFCFVKVAICYLLISG